MMLGTESFCIQGMWGKAILDKINLMIDEMRKCTNCDYDDLQILAGEDAYYRILNASDIRLEMDITPFEHSKLTFMGIEILRERKLRYDEIIVMKKPFRLWYPNLDEFNPHRFDDSLDSMRYSLEAFTNRSILIKGDFLDKWEEEEMLKKLKIKKVIYNAPATIVYWEDGTKTVVKAQNGEPFDKEKGLAMAMCKRMANDKGNYNDVFRKWCK